MKVVDWQCHFTEHQSHTWLAAQQFFDEEILHVVAKTSSSLRKEQGWLDVDLSGLNAIPLNKKGWWSQGIDLISKYPDAVHFFGGFWADRRFFLLILYALWCGRKVVVMNEAYATDTVGYLRDSSQILNGMKVLLRPSLYSMAAWLIKSLSGQNKFCILACSLRAVEQFEKAGFLREQLFPFGFFVPRMEGPSITKTVEADAVRIVFVGALLKRKGLDLAVSAVEKLHSEGLPVELDVFGYGEVADYINPQSKCVRSKGVIPFGQAQAVIADYDALILPSLHDGWGVVINEALLQGVPAIVSSHVGAKCMIEDSGAGMVFENGDVNSLSSVLFEFCSNPLLRKQQKKQAELIAPLISPENAARYMKDVFEYFFDKQGGRPDAIWLDQPKK